MTITEALDELEAWTCNNHQHHYGCEDDSTCCPGADRPYVDSLSLVEKIRELKEQI